MPRTENNGTDPGNGMGPEGAQRQNLRIGIVGGTFDPIHVGHLFIAVSARHALELDRTLLVVAHVPWQKVDERQVSPSELRLSMARAAVADHAAIEVSDIEVQRGGDSYTVDTVETLTAEHPEAQFFLVLGSDVAPNLNTWHRHEDLADLVEVAVIDRPGSVGARPPEGWRYTVIDTPTVNVSSTMLRKRLANGDPVDFVVPQPALDVYRRWHAGHTDGAGDNQPT